MTDTFEQKARLAKAEKLADTLARYPGGDDPAVVEDLPLPGWAMAAELAEVRPPSAATREVVLRIVEARRKLEAAASDPFAGFPTFQASAR